jgi:hypothetical protein
LIEKESLNESSMLKELVHMGTSNALPTVQSGQKPNLSKLLVNALLSSLDFPPSVVKKALLMQKETQEALPSNFTLKRVTGI